MQYIISYTLLKTPWWHRETNERTNNKTNTFKKKLLTNRVVKMKGSECFIFLLAILAVILVFLESIIYGHSYSHNLPCWVTSSCSFNAHSLVLAGSVYNHSHNTKAVADSHHSPTGLCWVSLRSFPRTQNPLMIQLMLTHTTHPLVFAGSIYDRSHKHKTPCWLSHRFAVLGQFN